jgi:hypothetical protein
VKSAQLVERELLQVGLAPERGARIRVIAVDRAHEDLLGHHARVGAQGERVGDQALAHRRPLGGVEARARQDVAEERDGARQARRDHRDGEAHAGGVALDRELAAEIVERLLELRGRARAGAALFEHLGDRLREAALAGGVERAARGDGDHQVNERQAAAGEDRELRAGLRHRFFEGRRGPLRSRRNRRCFRQVGRRKSRRRQRHHQCQRLHFFTGRVTTVRWGLPRISRAAKATSPGPTGA